MSDAENPPTTEPIDPAARDGPSGSDFEPVSVFGDDATMDLRPGADSGEDPGDPKRGDTTPGDVASDGSDDVPRGATRGATQGGDEAS